MSKIFKKEEKKQKVKEIIEKLHAGVKPDKERKDYYEGNIA